MTRGITIARKGVVKLNGKPTRWLAGRTMRNLWWVRTEDWSQSMGFTSRWDILAFLSRLSDEELLG